MRRESELRRLYDGHSQSLYAFLLNLTRNEADTRDLLQDVFVKLARDPNLLDGVRDERAFLVRLAHNAAIDLIRRRGTRAKTRDQKTLPYTPQEKNDNGHGNKQKRGPEVGLFDNQKKRNRQ